MQGRLSNARKAGRLVLAWPGLTINGGVVSRLKATVGAVMALIGRFHRRNTLVVRSGIVPRGSNLIGDQVANEAAEAKEKIRSCSVCGTRSWLARDSQSCPVCMLRRAVDRQSMTTTNLEASSSPKESSGTVEQASLAREFENYQLILNEQGKPIELGRGAMGVTYKAFDVDLRVPVALKVINEKYVGDKSVRLRFLREARGAASVRHPNVASVFHLGRTGQEYFYAMEFVEGETLESVIKRTGRVEVNLTIEITIQVAAGLEAVQKKNLVHRDLKPSNIMIYQEEGQSVTVKIIDLGLAKIVTGSNSDSVSSIAGSFAGTPEFASPEQFTGARVDIRSDLYSLGVTLWNMLAGAVPFRGTPAEVMYQHLYTPLPIERLQAVPFPLVNLVEKLLEKDPARRFQTPGELMRATLRLAGPWERTEGVKYRGIETHFLRNSSAKQVKFSPPRAAKRSIAVLPFANLSDTGGDTYFADGVHDEILSNLAKLSQLTVISRTSVMSCQTQHNQNIRSVAEWLGVANIVEGTVRRDGDRVRITVRLVNARTDKALWSEAYDRDLTDIFGVQSEIAQAVATKLTSRLFRRARHRIETKPNDVQVLPGFLGTLFYGVVVGDTTRLSWSLVFLCLGLLLAYPLPV
jgi:serine/threonine protein kinase